MTQAPLSRKQFFVRSAIVVALFATLYAPFLTKPIHIDDANFLMLSEGAAQDFWRPHDILINWSGSTEPAFDILANPPGIAWYLLPVRNATEWILHLWMLPWLGLGTWGCFRLAKYFTAGDGFYETAFMLTCPVIVISTHALTPDLPAFACLAAGVGGYLTTSRNKSLFALLAGCAVLFRYSGGLAIPFMVFIALRTGGIREALKACIVAVPVSLLALHDLHAYGEVHLFTMFVSQNEAKSLLLMFGNFIAGLAMLGGVALLPILVWRSETLFGAVVGGMLGWTMCKFAGVPQSIMLTCVPFCAAGVAALTLAFTSDTKDSILSTWVVAGALFFFVVRFAAARYWALFLPGIALLGLRNVQKRRAWLYAGLLANVSLSLLLAIDDQNHARANREAASKVASHGEGVFSGHWGWQHYLEQADWTPLECGEVVTGLFAMGDSASQQIPEPTQLFIVIEEHAIDDEWWGPRMHAPFAGASYHSSGTGRFAPWTFSDESYDHVLLLKPQETND